MHSFFSLSHTKAPTSSIRHKTRLGGYRAHSPYLHRTSVSTNMFLPILVLFRYSSLSFVTLLSFIFSPSYPSQPSATKGAAYPTHSATNTDSSPFPFSTYFLLYLSLVPMQIHTCIFSADTNTSSKIRPPEARYITVEQKLISERREQWEKRCFQRIFILGIY